MTKPELLSPERLQEIAEQWNLMPDSQMHAKHLHELLGHIQALTEQRDELQRTLMVELHGLPQDGGKP